jgi:iron complex outermembrane receptor protein
LSNKIILKRSVVAVALTLASSQFVSAQTVPAPAPAPAEDTSIQKVQITGSSLKRTAKETAGSVQILTRDDIERTGANTALGLITDAPGVDISINSATQGSGGFAVGSSAASMHSLGKVSTLVLVNGRRIAPYGLSDGAQQNFTNLDAISADAIERVEILRDGASAIYGSDAIAGVINIILRKEYKGAGIKAGYRYVPQVHAINSKNASFIYGFGDLDTNGFNTYLAFEAYKSPGYSTQDLKPVIPEWHRLTPGRSTWDAKSSYSPTGNYFRSSTSIVPAPGCPAADLDPVDGLCKFDTLKYAGQTTDNERRALTSNTHFRIGKDIDANFELTWADATNSYILAPFSSNNGGTTTATSIWYNVYGQKMVGPFTYPKLPVGHAYNPYTVATEVRSRLMDTGNGFNFNSTDSSQYRAMLALEGSWGDYDWKAAGGHMFSDAVKATRAVSAVGYTDAIVKGTYKFGQQNDKALLEAMFPIRTTVGESKITFIDGTITGEAFKMPAGPVSVALGFDLRRDDYMMKSSDNVLNGELVGIFGLQVADARTQSAIFGEASVPLASGLKMGAALRADKSSGFDAHVSPKLSLTWSPDDSILLRATGSGGFRAPNIVESGNGLGRSSVATGVNDIRRCPTATTLNNLIQNAPGATTADKAQGNTYRGNDCSAGLPSFVASNSDLKPETSKSFTIGAVFAPTKTFSLAVDYYKIERKDEIGTRSIVDVLKGEAGLKPGTLVRLDNTVTDNEFLALVKKYAPTNTVNFGGVGKLGIIYNPYVNSAKTRVSGLDMDINHSLKIENLGTLKTTLQANYNINYQTFSVANNAWNPNIVGNWDFGGKWDAKVITELKTGAWTNSLTFNFFSGYTTDNESSPTYCVTQNVPAQYMETCKNVKANIKANWSTSYTGFKNTKLAMTIINVTNRATPTDWRNGFSFTSPGLRTVYVNAAYSFK